MQNPNQLAANKQTMNQCNVESIRFYLSSVPVLFRLLIVDDDSFGLFSLV